MTLHDSQLECIRILLGSKDAQDAVRGIKLLQLSEGVRNLKQCIQPEFWTFQHIMSLVIYPRSLDTISEVKHGFTPASRLPLQ
jgi:hypothetical protein